MEKNRTPQTLIVGAIDFGTSNSGWACALLHDFKTDPTKSYVPNWKSGGRLETTKAPTCVLIAKEDEKLVEFGYDAENRFIDLVRERNQGKYYFFKEFKMALNKKIGQVFDRNLTIEDTMKKELPAMKVFSLTIAYLVNDLISKMNLQVTGEINKGDVQWVLTVPAIWTDSSKQFMSEAAVKAGIPENKLLIALEPEVASLYCQHVPLDISLAERQAHESRFQIGTRYMVLDAGGGTVDITIHEIDQNGGLKEIHAASGGGWGGTMVNQAFDDFMREIVGKEVYNTFLEEEVEDQLEFRRDVERKKETISPKTDSEVTLRIPASLPKIYHKHKKSTKEEETKPMDIQSKYGDQVKLEADKLRIQPSLVKAFFSESIEKIVHHVKSLLQLDKVKDITAILMVGGYSESPMLQDAIKSNFPDLNIIIPRESASAVLRGAVIFGFVPESIACRVLKYTYGYRAYSLFVEGTHPDEKKITTDHGVRCDDGFIVYATKHQTVKLGEEPLVKSMLPAYSTQKSLNISIYATRSKPPVVVNQSLTKIGELKIDLDDHDGDINRKISFSMSFDKTTIEARAKDEKTGKSVKASLNFLG